MSDTLSPISDLPLRHQRFIVEYLQDGNATQAAIRAGYRQNSAQEQGSQLLSKLMGYIEPIGRQHIKKRLMKAQDVVEGLVRIASVKFTDIASWEGDEVTWKSSADLPPEIAYCIESVEQHETQHSKYIKIKLCSKVKALDALAKHHNLFKQLLASKGLTIVYNRPQAQAVPEGAKVIEGEVIDGKLKPKPKRIEFVRPPSNGHGNGVLSRPNGKTGLHNGATSHDPGRA